MSNTNKWYRVPLKDKILENLDIQCDKGGPFSSIQKKAPRACPELATTVILPSMAGTRSSSSWLRQDVFLVTMLIGSWLDSVFAYLISSLMNWHGRKLDKKEEILRVGRTTDWSMKKEITFSGWNRGHYISGNRAHMIIFLNPVSTVGLPWGLAHGPCASVLSEGHTARWLPSHCTMLFMLRRFPRQSKKASSTYWQQS